VEAGMAAMRCEERVALELGAHWEAVVGGAA
jgi:hypothetical protein